LRGFNPLVVLFWQVYEVQLLQTLEINELAETGLTPGYEAALRSAYAVQFPGLTVEFSTESATNQGRRRTDGSNVVVQVVLVVPPEQTNEAAYELESEELRDLVEGAFHELGENVASLQEQGATGMAVVYGINVFATVEEAEASLLDLNLNDAITEEARKNGVVGGEAWTVTDPNLAYVVSNAPTATPTNTPTTAVSPTFAPSLFSTGFIRPYLPSQLPSFLVLSLDTERDIGFLSVDLTFSTGDSSGADAAAEVQFYAIYFSTGFNLSSIVAQDEGLEWRIAIVTNEDIGDASEFTLFLRRQRVPSGATHVVVYSGNGEIGQDRMLEPLHLQREGLSIGFMDATQAPLTGPEQVTVTGDKDLR